MIRWMTHAWLGVQGQGNIFFLFHYCVPNQNLGLCAPDLVKGWVSGKTKKKAKRPGKHFFSVSKIVFPTKTWDSVRLIWSKGGLVGKQKKRPRKHFFFCFENYVPNKNLVLCLRLIWLKGGLVGEKKKRLWKHFFTHFFFFVGSFQGCLFDALKSCFFSGKKKNSKKKLSTWKRNKNSIKQKER